MPVHEHNVEHGKLGSANENDECFCRTLYETYVLENLNLVHGSFAKFSQFSNEKYNTFFLPTTDFLK